MTNKYNHKIANFPDALRATAPYNFVPLPERVFVAPPDEQRNVHNRYCADRHTGCLVLKIRTETPLYTRCAYPPNVPLEEDGKPNMTKIRSCQDSFHHGNAEEPVIPGSTLRGMTRSLVEILAYAKMIEVTGKRLIHRAVGDPTSHGKMYRNRLANIRAGYLLVKSDGYYINPAITSSGRTFGRVKLGDLAALGNGNPHEVFDGYVSTTGRDDFGRWIHNSVSLRKTSTEVVEVTFLNTGDIDLKPGHTRKSFAIYERDTSRELKIAPKLWKLYEDDYEKSRLQSRSLRKLASDEPLFYLTSQDSRGNDVVEYFGSTMMFRIPYNPDNCEPCGISEFIPANLKHEKLDLAETIFGRVRQNTSETRAGRVFFTDAIWTNKHESPFLKNDEDDDGRRVPKILASPKPTSFQLYLNQPEVNVKKNRQDGATLKSYYNKGETLIRGTKIYWSKKSLAAREHWDKFAQNSETNLPRTNITVNGVQIEGEEGYSSQHTIIRPVKPGIEFEGQVYFENLTELELGALLTALELTSSAAPSAKRHRLGMGKPLGLGTVKIETEVHLESREPQENSSHQSRYELLFDDDGKWHMPQRADSRIIADECKKIFRQQMLAHHNSAVRSPQVDQVKDDLAEIPRLKALFDMLEWNGSPQESQTRYLDPNRGQDKEVIRQRYVLPNPRNVLENSASYKYEIEVSEENDQSENDLNSHEQTTLTDPGETPERPDQSAEVESLLRTIGSLKGKGEVSRVAGIVTRISLLTDGKKRREVGERLKQWLIANGIWRSEKHREKDWRKRLEEICPES